MSNNVRSTLLCYGCAAVSVAVAIWARLLLDPALGNQLPFLTVFFAILLTAWYGGFRPALAAAILGGLSANYFIMPPRGTFAIAGTQQQVGMILYCVTSLGIASLGGLMHAARRRAEASAKGERRQAALIDQAHDAVLVWEWKGPILFWNRGAERLYGFPSTEAVGRLSHELLHTSTSGGLAGMVAALERQGSWEGELEHTTRAGRRIIVETRMVLVRQAEPPYVLEANRDITERRRMEDDLREVNERFRLLVEDVEDYAIFALDLTGRVVTWNAGLERLKGYLAQDIIGHHFSRFYTEEDLATGKPERELQQALAQGRCEDIGWRIRKDGSRFWARVVITTLRDDAGQPRGFTKITRDITDSKRAEERFRQAVESAPNGMVMIDATGRIILVNAQTERLFGYSRDEMLGQLIEKLVPERFRGQHPEYRDNFFAQPQVRSMGVGRDLYGQRKDGSEFPVEIGLNPINTEQGLLVLSAIVDITERKRAEASLKETEARLQLFITHAPAALAMFDRDMRYLAVSRRWLCDYGLGDSNIIGRLHSEIFPEIPERWKALHRRGLAGEVFQVDAECFERADGSVQWLRWEMRPWPAADGGIGGIVLFTEDITERKQTEEALREREAQLHAADRRLAEIMHGMTEACYALDAQWRFTFVNDRGETLFHRKREELLGRSIWDVFHKLVGTPMEAYYRRAMAERVPMTFEVFSPIVERWVDIRLFPTREGLAAFLLDINARKLSEEALRDSEDQFRTMANSIPQLAWMAHADGFLFWYNLRWHEYTGTTPEQMEGWGWQSVHDPDVLPKVLQGWRAAIATGQPFEMEFPLRGADGRFRMFLTRVQPMKDSQGRVVQWFGTNTDIEELKRMEESLRDTQARLNSTLAAGSIGTWSWDLVNDLLVADEFTARMFSIETDAAAKGMSAQVYLQVIHEEDRLGVTDALDCAIKACGHYDIEYRIRQKDGGVRWLQARGRVECDAAGHALNFYGAVMDVTERKVAEEAVHQLNETLEQRVIERTAQLEAANKELEAFSYSVSHDLRAPLRAIDGFSRILLKHHASQLSEEGRAFFQDIRDNTVQMGRLVDDLLAFSRLGRQPVKKQEVDTGQIVRQCLDELWEAQEGRQVDIRVGDLPTCPCQADPALLKQVWFNLLANALKYSGKKETSVIEVGCRCDAGRPVYFVKDNGVGFDMQYAHKLFGVFQRLHRSEDYEGTGVGLAIVQRIIQRHGGQIWAEAQVDRGATFFFTLDSEGPLHA